MPHTNIAITEKLSILARALGIVPALFRQFFRTPLSLHQIRIAAARYITAALTIRQIQYVIPPSSTGYTNYIQSLNLTPSIDTLLSANGAVTSKLLWLPHPPYPDQVVLLYFHGGGYVMPMLPAHWKLLSHIQAHVGPKLSIAALEYSLTPAHKYPYQLAQAALALGSLIERGVLPKNIIIAGDSAGGNLALSLLSHLLHPHPTVPALPPFPHPLAGIALISPATTFSTTADAFVRNAERDTIGRGVCEYWMEELRRGGMMQAEVGRGEYWGDTKGSGEAWWRGVAALVRRVLVTAGEDEVLVDDVKRLVRVFEGLEESWIVESLVVKGEVHDAPLMDFVSGVGRGPGVGAWAVARWVKEATERQYL